MRFWIYVNDFATDLEVKLECVLYILDILRRRRKLELDASEGELQCDALVFHGAVASYRQ